MIDAETSRVGAPSMLPSVSSETSFRTSHLIQNGVRGHGSESLLAGPLRELGHPEPSRIDRHLPSFGDRGRRAQPEWATPSRQNLQQIRKRGVVRVWLFGVVAGAWLWSVVVVLAWSCFRGYLDTVFPGDIRDWIPC